MELTVDGHAVFAATGGRGFDPGLPGAIFIHGAGNDHSVWQMPVRYFAYHGRAVLAPDLPGHGRSGGEALTTIEAMGGWVGRLLDESGLKATALVGHSMGALIALAAAAKLGERVSALALLGAAPTIPVHPDLIAAAEHNDHVAFELIVSWGFAPAAQLGGHRAPGLWMTGGGMRLLERIPEGVFATDLKACDTFGGAQKLSEVIACPVHLILGDRDRLTPVKGGKALAAMFRGSRTVVLPDCGHMMLAEKPDETLDALREAL